MSDQGYTGKRPGGRFKGRRKLLKIKPQADPKLQKVFKSIGIPKKKPFTPDPFQLEALAAIEKGDCLVTAPTGAGKTWIAEQTIAKIRGDGGRAWYASPLKALTNSKYIEFSEEFGPENVGILTGDRKENPDGPILVGTTEILRNQLYDAMHHGEDLDTDFVILDEAHFLGDEDRGVVWEEIMIYLPPRIPMLLLSATIGNADQIAAWLASIRHKECIVVRETQRPVPLYPIFFHPSGTLYPLLDDRSGKGKRKLHPKVNAYVNDKFPPRLAIPGKLPRFGDILRVLRKYRLLPAIFFLKSRADCDHALELCEQNILKDQERKDRIHHRIEEAVGYVPHLAKHNQLGNLERLAVGAHHSGQLPAWKLLVESLMTDGLLDAVFATSTVAAGVNFPARTVAFLNSDKFNGVEFMPLTSTEFHQMTGRAGRRGMDRIGFGLVLPNKYMDIRHVAKMISAPPGDVLSQIRINFSMTLNLLLSHVPDQIQVLLRKSFATYLLTGAKKKKKETGPDDAQKDLLWQDFQKHFHFLKETGFVSSSGTLTEDGIWASQLRVDYPLLIAEGFRKGLFPQDDPRMLAAIICSFVNERETDERIEKEVIPNPLQKTFNNVVKGLKPFVDLMKERGFPTRPLYRRPALVLFLWASEVYSWDKVLSVAETAEGDLSMLILRTADNLRHIAALRDVFPDAAQSASKAIELILREPVITYYEP